MFDWGIPTARAIETERSLFLVFKHEKNLKREIFKDE
jgi:hypothetical protein